MYFLTASWFFFGVLVSYVAADIPVNCTYEDIKGIWEFSESNRNGSSEINCPSFKGPFVRKMRFELLYPNITVDELGNKGFWTMIYNQGFEVVINYRKYFAFSEYEDDDDNVTSYCDTVIPGWSHDVLGKNWACYKAKKIEPIVGPKFQEKPRRGGSKAHPFFRPSLQDDIFNQDKDFIDQINQVQKSWTAKFYPELEGLTMSTIIRRSGGIKSRVHRTRRSLVPENRTSEKTFADLPEEIDWRNVSGVNYVSPVRDQDGCGSCFAFASMAMLEARLRVATNNTVQEVFSIQDIISCDTYAEGCDGGYTYLTAGKYAQDFGVIPEECYPYTAEEDAKSECAKKKCKRYYVADYNYVGGYYGGCNEELMKLELVTNGPLSASMETHRDFHQYEEGIYHYTGGPSKYSPFIYTNHAVLLVGYGVDRDTGEKYWIAKNSWGTNWGEDGFFKIRRGTNENNIESSAVAATIIP